jgi:tetratricopeptide (TPR) repeat protein
LFFAKASKDKEAMQQIDKSLKKDPNNDKLLSIKALLLWELGSEEEVFDFLNDAKNLAPNSVALAKIEERIKIVQNMFSNVDSKYSFLKTIYR